MNTRIIAVDVSEEALQSNHDVDEKRVANVAQSLPFKTNEVDIVTSRFVLEHLEAVESFVSLCSRVLKTDGYFIHLFPSKFAPFALINQVMPDSLARKLLYLIYPDTKGGCGFTSYYNKCYYTAMKRLLQKHGFRVIDAHFGYYQSRYFAFLAPLFLISAIYELLLQMFKAKNLSPYIIIVAQKRADKE